MIGRILKHFELDIHPPVSMRLGEIYEFTDLLNYAVLSFVKLNFQMIIWVRPFDLHMSINSLIGHAWMNLMSQQIIRLNINFKLNSYDFLIYTRNFSLLKWSFRFFDYVSLIYLEKKFSKNANIWSNRIWCYHIIMKLSSNFRMLADFFQLNLNRILNYRLYNKEKWRFLTV